LVTSCVTRRILARDDARELRRCRFIEQLEFSRATMS